MNRIIIASAFAIYIFAVSAGFQAVFAQESPESPGSEQPTDESGNDSVDPDADRAGAGSESAGNSTSADNLTAPESQRIITAAEYFDEVSKRYAEIEDYQADIVITQTDSVMRGTLYHKRPDMVLVEFEEPEEQVISADGVTLKIYIPYLNVVMEQTLEPYETPEVGLATEEGLQMMKEKYSVAYLESQDYVPLDEGSVEMVRKLKLEWKNINEGFRELILSVSRDRLIRRIEGITANIEELTIDFTNIVTNQDLPSRMFVYESPSSAYAIKNFLFEPEEE